MKNIKNFSDFNKINEEEGWKEKALAATIAAGALGSTANTVSAKTTDSDSSKKELSYQEPTAKKGNTINWPGKPKTKIVHRTTDSEEEATRLSKIGWTLDSSTVDTLWKEVLVEKPDTNVIIDEIRFDDAQFFASGRYILTEDMKDSINSVINEIIGSGGTIVGIQVESSTDKQRLSLNLQKELKDQGYRGDNTGLSKIRCEQITNYLENIGIDSSIISTNQLVEAGKGEIDSSARYVTVKLVYLTKEIVSTPSIVEKVPEVKEKYYLSKEVKIPKKKTPRKHRIKRHKVKRSKVSNINKCFEF